MTQFNNNIKNKIKIKIIYLCEKLENKLKYICDEIDFYYFLIFFMMKFLSMVEKENFSTKNN